MADCQRAENRKRFVAERYKKQRERISAHYKRTESQTAGCGVRNKRAGRKVAPGNRQKQNIHKQRNP